MDARVLGQVAEADVLLVAAQVGEGECGWHVGDEVAVAVTPQLVTNSAEAALDHEARGGGGAIVLAYQAMALLRRGRLRARPSVGSCRRIAPWQRG